MISLSWPQVCAWRLSQHSLQQRASGNELLAVVNRLGGVQAQLMSAAELAIWARVEGITPEEIQAALWRERSLIKTWAMRGTLHLIPSREFALYVAARSAFNIRRPPSYYTYHGVTPSEVDAILDSVPRVLGETPLTREELADAVAERSGMPALREVLLSGWGALLKPLAFRGDLCFGPNRGANITFVRPDRWIPSSMGAIELHSIEPQAAIKEMARRYLSTFGPATMDDFARWWHLQAGQAKKVFQSLGDEIAAVEVEGWKAWALTGSLEQLAGKNAPRSLRLLPLFDAYTFGVPRDNRYVLAEEHKPRVYRPQGWISAVVLVDGRIAGTWEHGQEGPRTVVRIHLFAPPPGQVESEIKIEARNLGDFLGTEIVLVST